MNGEAPRKNRGAGGEGVELRHAAIAVDRKADVIAAQLVGHDDDQIERAYRRIGSVGGNRSDRKRECYRKRSGVSIPRRFNVGERVKPGYLSRFKTGKK